MTLLLFQSYANEFSEISIFCGTISAAHTLSPTEKLGWHGDWVNCFAFHEKFWRVVIVRECAVVSLLWLEIALHEASARKAQRYRHWRWSGMRTVNLKLNYLRMMNWRASTLHLSWIPRHSHGHRWYDTHPGCSLISISMRWEKSIKLWAFFEQTWSNFKWICVNVSSAVHILALLIA